MASKASAPIEVMPFTGFPKEAIQFFRDIEKNNALEWYNAHAADYKQYVIQPAQAFIEAVGPKLRKVAPGVQWHPDPNGKGSIKKIQTDRRFNPGRDPYKTFLAIFFWEGPLAVKKENSCFYLRLDAKGIDWAAGLKYFERPVLAAYRQAVLDDKRGKELDSIVKTLRKEGFDVGGSDGFKKLPAGVAPDHPRAPQLLHNALYAGKHQPLNADLHSPKLVDVTLQHFKALAPLHKWCVSLLSS